MRSSARKCKAMWEKVQKRSRKSLGIGVLMLMYDEGPKEGAKHWAKSSGIGKPHFDVTLKA